MAEERVVDFLDISNGYGVDGTVKRRIGAAIAPRGGLPAALLLATEVDPDPATGAPPLSGRVPTIRA